jgi:hypothetical protein
MWNSPAIYDCLWERITSIEFCTLFLENEDDIVRFVCNIFVVSKELNRLSSSFLRNIHRAFLPTLTPPVRASCVKSCISVRKFIKRAQSGLKSVLDIENVCISGEFASWELERKMEMKQGKDGFPWGCREVSIWDGIVRNEIWNPFVLELFVECSPDQDTDALLILEHYFLDHLENVVQFSFLKRENKEEAEACGEAEDEDIVSAVQECTSLPEKYKTASLDGLLSRNSSKKRFRSVVIYPLGIKSVINPFQPFVLSTTFTRPSDRKRYVPFPFFVNSSSHFDHLRVSIVMERSGTFSFYTDKGAVDSLLRRKIEIKAGGGTKDEVTTIVNKIVILLKNGFRFSSNFNVTTGVVDLLYRSCVEFRA